ncbi:non-POU domain-containing octamer-binding protein-like isoform X3 [Varroa destructor]|uniref:RRM domain-containing protein n=1 Tax=Varroa destructor TaxID=109461 RepID=A0A7M7MHY3_VARDE|nr:non-POU domain-containing octamer-binding protein-like isoform X3 [Varroa destructor]
MDPYRMGGAGGGGYGGSVWQSYGDMLQGAGGPVGRSQDYHNEPFGGHRDSFGGLDQGIGGGSGGFMGGRGQGSDQGGFMGGGGGGRRGGLHDTSGGGYGQENLGGSGGYLRQQQQPDPYDGYGSRGGDSFEAYDRCGPVEADYRGSGPGLPRGGGVAGGGGVVGGGYGMDDDRDRGMYEQDYRMGGGGGGGGLGGGNAGGLYEERPETSTIFDIITLTMADRYKMVPERPARRPMRPGEKPDPIKDQLYEMQGNTYNLQSANVEPKKFTARCRLFIAPLPNSVSEDDLKQWFGQYGEVGEVFLNKQKNFAFVKMDTRENCEAAKNSLDFAKKDGVTIRVRYSSNPAAVRVSNLTNFVTNELLESAFGVFGEIERAVVIADERGRPTGEGIVEFAQKRSALMAIRRCEEECFLLTASPRPVVVEPYDFRDEDEGLPERNIAKSKAYAAERELRPRTAMPGSFEFEFGAKWKSLFEMEAQRKEELEYDTKRCRQALDEQLDFYMYEHETKLLREKLRAMEEQSQQIQRDREMRLRAEDGERRRREEEDYRRRMEGGAGGLLDTARRNALGAGLTGSLGGLSGAGGGQPGRGGGWNTGPPQVPPPYQSSMGAHMGGGARY